MNANSKFYRYAVQFNENGVFNGVVRASSDESAVLAMVREVEDATGAELDLEAETTKYVVCGF